MGKDDSFVALFRNLGGFRQYFVWDFEMNEQKAHNIQNLIFFFKAVF